MKSYENHINGNLYAYAANNPVHYIDPDGREAYSLIKMGGYKLSSSEIFNQLISFVDSAGLMGKTYSTDPSNVYVCSTFVDEVLSNFAASKNIYLPGGQRVIDSVTKLGDLKESNGINPSEGTYVFYYINKDGQTGHTGFVNFDKDGNTKILHNGSNGNGEECVNIRTRDSRDFKTWFTKNDEGTLYYKKLEIDLWAE